MKLARAGRARSRVLLVSRSIGRSRRGRLARVYMVRLRAVPSGRPGAASNEVASWSRGVRHARRRRAPDVHRDWVDGDADVECAGRPVTSYVLVAGYAPSTSTRPTPTRATSFTSFVATGVPSATYYVRIQAKNACGVSDFSNEAMVVVPLAANN